MPSDFIPFPQAGSFALFIDPDLPAGDQRPELVRIVRWVQTSWARAGLDCCQIALPLRAAADFKIIQRRDLIDGTTLSRAEAVELADLQRHLRDRQPTTARLQDKFERMEALRQRAVWSPILNRLLRECPELLVAA
jgi:hypothetical protein